MDGLGEMIGCDVAWGLSALSLNGYGLHEVVPSKYNRNDLIH